MGTDGSRRVFGDGTLRVDLTVAAAAILALAGTGWLIRDELQQHGANGEEDVAVGVAASIVGSAKRRPGASLVWTRLDIGERLGRGDGVFVAEDSALDVQFLDGSHLLVSESSLVVVDLPGAAAGARARVDVRRGSVSGKAGSVGLLFEVHGSSVALAGGGVASVSGGGDSATRVSVEKGEANVRGSGGGAARVRAKQTTVVSEGRVAAVRDLTVELAVPSSGASVYFTGDAAVVPFEWSGGAGVLEVADNMTFANVVRRRAATAGTSVRLAGGGYFWRVSDRNGEPLSPARVLNVVRDDRPAPLQPATDSVLYLANQETATFAWSRVAGVSRYRVELAVAEDFAELAFSAEVDGPHLRFGERLPEGDYYWRVRSLAPERGASPWTVPVPFKLAFEPLPRAPELYDSEVEVIERRGSKKRGKAKPEPTPDPDEGASLLYRLFVGGVAHAAAPSAAIILRWEAVPGVRRYVLEIAEDKSFATVVVRQELTENWYRWRKISKREFWWRVKSIDVKGREGVFSQPRSVGAVLSAPRLLTPKSAETVLIAAKVPRIRFSWEGQRLAGRYEWSLAADAAFSRGTVTKTTRAPNLEWQPTGAGTLFWRVRAADAGGSYTSYSKTYRIEVKLAAPVASSAVGEVLMSSPPPKVELAARAVATARAYEIQVASKRSFANPTVSVRTKAPRWEFEPQVAGVWWWRWRARSGASQSPWGKPVSLDVRVAQPVISAPVAGARVGFRAAEGGTSIEWAPGPGAAGYEVVVSADGADVARVEVASPPATIPGLAAGSYNVRVRALRASGAAAVSESIAFERVALPPLLAPSPVEPAVDTWLVTAESQVDVRFGWDAVDGAGAYELEVVARDGDWVRTREEGVAASRAELHRGAYEWRVRAVDDAGIPGAYSEAAAFRVGPSPPATAVIAIEPEPVTSADVEVRIDIVLRDGDGQPVAGAELEATALRGSIHDLRDAGDGRYVARYQPPSDFDAGPDTVAVTVPGLTTFREEEAVRLSAGGWGLLLGGAVGLVSNFEAVLSPTVQLEAGYRLPWLRGRLIATLRVGYHYARKTDEGELRVAASQYSIPIALGLKLELPYWVVVPYGSANVLFGVLVGRLKVVGQDEIFRTELGMGADLGVGGALALGPGDLFAEIRFGWMRRSDEDDLFELDGGGLVPVVGYRVEL